MQVFGWEIKRKDDDGKLQSFVERTDDDGAIVVADGIGQRTYLDLDGAIRNEAELIHKYRKMHLQPEVQQAIDDIVNEAIVISDDQKVVELNLDDVEGTDKFKEILRKEFDIILKLLDFSNRGYEIFTKWYTDGRLYYHAMVDPDKVRDGIKELRYIDPRKIRKVIEYENSATSATKKIKNEYYLYNDDGFLGNNTGGPKSTSGLIKEVRIGKDAVVHCNSGLYNENNTMIVSHLHKAMKVLNNLRMMEDSAVIYRISRAPERRIFYIDVGNLPKAKAEQYLRSMMVKYQTRLGYDSESGEMRDERRIMSVTDDFWLPRRDGKGTEIDTLQAGQNLGEMEEVEYFQKKLYRALNVPISRLEPETVFNLGRSNEISRDEIKFSKFISRLRARFSVLFDQLLEKQLILKNIVSVEDWNNMKDNIRYDFMKDNYYEELKETEILRERINSLREIDEYHNKYFSKSYIQKKILRLTDEEIEEMEKEIEEDMKESGQDEDSLNIDDKFNSI